MPMEHPYFWWGAGMWLFPILFLAIVVGVTYLVVRQGNIGQPRERLHTGPAETSDSAIEIAKRRYAQGEINKEEFLQMKKDLSD